MKEIKVSPYPKFDQETFLHVVPFDFLEVGGMYKFTEFRPNEDVLPVISRRLCISVEKVLLGDITAGVTFLDKDTDPETYKKIYDLRNFNLQTIMYVGVFTRNPIF